jgi:hypothetical protein
VATEGYATPTLMGMHNPTETEAKELLVLGEIPNRIQQCSSTTTPKDWWLPQHISH